MVIELTPAFTAYLAAYTLACAVAAILMIRERKTLVLFRPEYRKFMTSKWKLLTFAVAALSMIVIAPYTGDPTCMKTLLLSLALIPSLVIGDRGRGGKKFPR